MNNNLTELVFVLDKSGSMSGLESDTIGGFNSMLEKQKKEEGEALITTVLFDNEYEILHDRKNIKNINLITDKEYYVGGTTALLDALGRTVNRISKAISESNEDNRPCKVMFVIITDGMENASREYNYNNIKNMVEYNKTKNSWEFIFLGANIDAIATASKFGINEDRAVNFCADSTGTKLNYKAVCNAVSEFRSDFEMSSEWKEIIEEDYNERSIKTRKK